MKMSMGTAIVGITLEAKLFVATGSTAKRMINRLVFQEHDKIPNLGICKENPDVIN